MLPGEVCGPGIEFHEVHEDVRSSGTVRDVIDFDGTHISFSVYEI